MYCTSTLSTSPVTGQIVHKPVLHVGHTYDTVMTPFSSAVRSHVMSIHVNSCPFMSIDVKIVMSKDSCQNSHAKIVMVGLTGASSVNFPSKDKCSRLLLGCSCWKYMVLST